MATHKQLNEEFPGLDWLSRDCLQSKLTEIVTRNGAVLCQEHGYWVLWHPGHDDQRTKTLQEMAVVVWKLRRRKIFL